MRQTGKKKIVQMLPILAYGDAIGNDVLAIDNVLREGGYQTEIYAETIDHRLKRKNVKHITKYRDRPDTVIIYHLSTGNAWNREVTDFDAPLVIHYHNITPPNFFHRYNAVMEIICRKGLNDVAWLKDKVSFCIADSEFNKHDLLRMGYDCPIEVLPIILAYADYKKEPDAGVLKTWKKEGQTHLIFTGRVAPNKKQEDLIRSFYYYHKYLNPSSILHIVGSYDSGGRYYQRLAEYVEYLGLTEAVNFTGHIPFNQILAYYRLADMFLCMSEHEGFCVPLVEAMFFKVPIIAYNSAAVGDTLGKGGILLDEKDPVLVAETIHYVICHPEVRAQLIKNGEIQLSRFSHKETKEILLSIMDRFGF